MAVANLFMVSSLGTFFLFPLFVTHSQGTKVDIGLLMGAMAFSAVACRPWISQMVDRLGRKKSFAVGAVIMTVMPLTYIFMDGPLTGFYAPLLVVRVIHGIGEACCFTASFTYIADIVPDDRLNEGIGMFGTTGLMGMALGPTIAEIVIRDYGFTACFLTGSALGLASLLLQMPLKESYVPSEQTTPPSFMAVLRRGKIMTIASMALVFGIGLAAYGAFVSPFAQELKLPMISLYFISYSSAAIVTRLFGGRLADRVGEHRVVPYALIITGLGLLLLNWLNGSLLLVVSGLITGLGHGLLYPTLNTLAIRHEPIDIRGKINGIYTGSIDAGVMIGSIFLGFIGEAYGYPRIFLTAGLGLFTGFLIFLTYALMTRSKPRP